MNTYKSDWLKVHYADLENTFEVQVHIYNRNKKIRPYLFDMFPL